MPLLRSSLSSDPLRRSSSGAEQFYDPSPFLLEIDMPMYYVVYPGA